MSLKDFIPGRDGDLDAYEQNFANKMALHADTLAMDPAEVAKIRSNINNHRMAYANVISKRAESKSATEDNQGKKVLAVNELRRAAQMIKSLSNYNASIGDDLQIIGPKKPVKDITGLKPVLSTKLNGLEVKVKYTKEEMHGVKLYSRRSTESEFVFLGISILSPYVDSRPKIDSSKPEQREYYAVLFDDVNEVGKRSDIVRATVP